MNFVGRGIVNAGFTAALHAAVDKAADSGKRKTAIALGAVAVISNPVAFWLHLCRDDGEEAAEEGH